MSIPVGKNVTVQIASQTSIADTDKETAPCKCSGGRSVKTVKTGAGILSHGKVDAKDKKIVTFSSVKGIGERQVKQEPGKNIMSGGNSGINNKQGDEDSGYDHLDTVKENGVKEDDNYDHVAVSSNEKLKSDDVYATVNKPRKDDSLEIHLADTDTDDEDDIYEDLTQYRKDPPKEEIATNRKSKLLGKMKGLGGKLKKKGASSPLLGKVAKGAKKLAGGIKKKVASKLKKKGMSIRDSAITAKKKVVKMLPQKVANGVALNVISPKTLKERVIGKVSAPKSSVQRAALKRLETQTKAAFEEAGAPTKDIKQAKSQLKKLEKQDAMARKIHDHHGNVDFTVAGKEISDLKEIIANHKSTSTKEITKKIIEGENEVYEKQLEALESQAKDVEEEKNEIKQTVKELKSQLKELIKGSNIKELRREVDQLESDVEELTESGVEGDEQGMVSLGGETFDLAEMEKELSAKQEELKGIDEKVVDLENSLEDAKESLTEKREEYAEMGKTIRQAKRDNDRKATFVRQIKR